MPKLVWNGGFELDWKFILAVLAYVFSAGGAWWKLNDIEAVFRTHLVDSKIESYTLVTHGYRLGSLETRIDFCCPLYHPDVPVPRDLTPKDIFPGGRPAGEP